MELRQILVLLLLERKCLRFSEVTRITSSTPATSIRRLPAIEGVTAAIGRLLCSITAIRTDCPCLARMSTQVPMTAVSTVATVLGVWYSKASRFVRIA